MAIVCLQCANENPPDHSYCHQCGSRLEGNSNDATPGSSLAFVRRPPDESRLPPPGSFRSGLYRLVRALFVNQKPVTTRPVRIARIAGERGGTESGAAAGRQRKATAADESKRSGDAPDAPTPAAGTATYWLARAVLLPHQLPGRATPLAVPATAESLSHCLNCDSCD